MKKFYWPAIIVFTIGFFYFFWKLEPIKPVGNKVKLSHKLDTKIIYINEFDQNKTITISLKVENPTDKAYSSNDYFYRMVLNRSYYYSPGFIIKEFSKDLGPKESFEEVFAWPEKYFPNQELEFWVHFNMYKRNKDKEPTITATNVRARTLSLKQSR